MEGSSGGALPGVYLIFVLGVHIDSACGAAHFTIEARLAIFEIFDFGITIFIKTQDVFHAYLNARSAFHAPAHVNGFNHN